MEDQKKTGVLRYLIVGSGYRAAFYARVAKKYPSAFRALVLCRTQEKADAISSGIGIETTASTARALSFEPDFVVVVVDKENLYAVTEAWAERGFPVLTETPAATTVENLEKLWLLSTEKRARIVCAEQYCRYPILASGISLLEDGLIGRIDSVSISLAHDYHAFSLIRRLLHTRGEKYSLRANQSSRNVLATDSRSGPILDGRSRQEERVTAFLSFSSGKTAVYDFASVQYHSFIRSRHLTVRGERGEWSDRILSYADEGNRPQRIFLMPEVDERYRELDTQCLSDGRKTWSPELFLDTEQDEFAIASVLLDMGDYLAGGEPPYLLRDALNDAYFGILLKEALEHPWVEHVPLPMPWEKGERI